MKKATYLFATMAMMASAFVNNASGQLLYSFEADEEEWTATTIVGDYDDNEAVVTSVSGVGNTDGSKSLKVVGRSASMPDADGDGVPEINDYVRTTQVTLDPDRVEAVNLAVENGWNLEFDWTIVAAENPGAQRYWVQLALGTSAGWTQNDMFVENGWPEWDPNGPAVQTMSPSIPLEDFGNPDLPGYCCGLALDGLSTSYTFYVATGGSVGTGDTRTYYLDNFRLVDPSVVNPIPGDFNDDKVLTAADIDLLTSAVLSGSNDKKFDVNSDNAINGGDRTHWVENLRRTYFGDSNLDSEFNSGDFVAVFTAGQYEDTTQRNSTWATGDWNGDGDFDSSDFVSAFTAGGYEKGPRAAVNAVPEPTGLALCAIAMLGFAIRRRVRG